MRKLDVTPITDSSEFPVTRGTLQFLQDAFGELFPVLLQAMIGSSYNSGVVYSLFGVRNLGTAPAYNVTGGAVLYNGEIFLVDPASFTATGSNVGVLQIVTTQYTTNADPVTFTDSVIRNVHNIRKMQVAQGASGTGIADLTAISYPPLVGQAMLNLTATGQASASGAYPNININVPVSGNLNPILGAGSVHIGDVPGGGVTIAVPFGGIGQCPVLPGGQQYFVLGQLKSQGGSPHDDTTVTVTVIESSQANTGFSIRCQEWTSGVQSLAFDYIIFAK